VGQLFRKGQKDLKKNLREEKRKNKRMALPQGGDDDARKAEKHWAELS